MIPGATGVDGAGGAPGTDGLNAFTSLAAAFVVPAIGAAVVVEVVDSQWMVPWSGGGVVYGQALAIEFAGSFLISDVPDDTHVEITNMGWTGTALAGTNIPAGARVGPSGVPGATAGPVTGALLAANNLNDLTNLAAAQSNLGLGTAAFAALTALLQAANNLSDVPVKATARTNLGLAIGTNVQAYSAFLAGLVAAGPGGADLVPYLTAANTFSTFTATSAMRALLASATNAALLNSLKVMPRYGLLGSLTGVDMNVPTNDNAVTLVSSRYRLDKVTIENASVNLTTATAGVFTAAGGGGTTLAADQSLAALSASTKFLDIVLQAVCGTDILTAGTLYFRTGTAQGVAATANVWLWGWRCD